MILLGSISSRNEFGTLLRPAGVGVEVGTHRGAFAAILLQGWSGARLTCVDPWSVPPGYERQAAYLESSTSREDDYRVAVETLAPFGTRVQLMRAMSAEAVKAFPDGSLDFVYLDGSHEPPHVSEDLELWWPKVASGGLLAGHDIVMPGPPGPDNWGRYIQPAVLEFAERQGVDVFLVVEEGGLPWSYYLVKP